MKEFFKGITEFLNEGTKDKLYPIAQAVSNEIYIEAGVTKAILTDKDLKKMISRYATDKSDAEKIYVSVTDAKYGLLKKKGAGWLYKSNPKYLDHYEVPIEAEEENQ